MNFLNEQENRRYFMFLLCFCVLLWGSAALAGRLQAQAARGMLLEQEQAVVSSLLLQEVPADVIASAYKNEKITAEGVDFLAKIGWSPKTDPWLLPAVRERSAAFLLFAGSAALGMSILLVFRAVCFLRRREDKYREAETIIAEFAAGNFTHHLCRDREGALYQMFGAAEQLSRALKAEGEAAQKAKAALENAVSDISHQLKTPLAALSMYAQIMQEEPENPQIVREFSQKSEQAISRMELLIRSLLKVMRLDAGSVIFEKRSCRVSELVLAATQELRVRAEREKKRLIWEGDEEELLNCDLTWTAEALSNLVKNALDHTEEGGTVRIGWQRSHAMLRIWVRDDGCGISPEDMPHIFKRFYQSRNSADLQGCGLGLALAKSIVEGQGGTLTAASELGKETVFTMAFLTEP
ncbi:MAG: HAMP domain-containing sensor histidine kinase [Eubacteriales bacterium]|nr:HAMP domain-containing sensor histidine kinase [Eubacteriales bacterium]